MNVINASHGRLLRGRQPTSRGTRLGTIALAGALLAACAGGGGGGGGGGGVEQEEGPVTLSFAHWRAEDREVFDQLIAEFTKANPDIKIEQAIFPSEQYQATAQVKIRDGSVGDVFTAFRGAQFENIAKAGLYVDLSDEEFVKQYDERLIEPGQRDGKQLGLPYHLVFNDPIYNVAIFEKVGVTVPKDFPALLDACKKIWAAGYAPIAWPGGDPTNAGQLINTMPMNNMPSEDAFAQIESGKQKATDEWWVKTLGQYKQMADAGCFQDNFLGTKTDGALAMFAQEQAAALATGSFQMSVARTQNPNLKMGIFAPITTEAGEEPKYDGAYNATFILGVNSKSSKQAAAKKWVEFLSDPKNAATYANGTIQNATVAGVEYTNPDLAVIADWAKDKNLILAPRFQFNNLEVRTAFENSVIATLSGKSPVDAAAEAQAIIDQKI